MTEKRDGWVQTDGYRICRPCNGGCDPGPAEYLADVEFCCACCFEKKPPVEVDEARERAWRV